MRFQIIGKGCRKQQCVRLPGLRLGGSDREFEELLDFCALAMNLTIRVTQYAFNFSQGNLEHGHGVPRYSRSLGRTQERFFTREMRLRHPPREHALDAFGIKPGKNFSLLLVKIKARFAGIHEALKLKPQNLHERKPSSRHEPGKNALIGDRIVQVPVLEPAMQSAEVALHVRHGKVTARIEVEEQAETPTF